MRKKIFFMLLIFTLVLFFFGMRLLKFIMGSESHESLGSEIILSIMCGYGGSIGLFFQYKNAKK